MRVVPKPDADDVDVHKALGTCEVLVWQLE
jgi:hypothetical protein